LSYGTLFKRCKNSNFRRKAKLFSRKFARQ